MNKAYYAMFYAGLALLLTKGLGASKHAGVLALVDREFVPLGVLPVDLSRSFRDAFNPRQKADYAEFANVEKEEATEVLHNAQRFVEEVKKLIEGN